MRRSAFAVLLFASLASAQPIPFDLAFSRREIPRAMRPVLSPDERYLAYEVLTPPVKSPDSAGEIEPRVLPNGVPAVFSGMNLYVSDVRTGESRAVCDANTKCWRGSWSPDSRQLAYYSDAGGDPHVWLYDVASHQSRKLSDLRVKTKTWIGDEAQWSRDGKTLYVLIAPPPPKKLKAVPLSEGLSDTAHVTVYRTHGDPGSIEADPDPAAAINRHSINENNASIAALDVASGEAHMIVNYDAGDRPSLFRLSPDGTWISYVTVPRAKSAEAEEGYEDLVIVPVKGGAPVAEFRDLITPLSLAYALTDVFRWTPDSRRIVFLKDHGLWIADLSGKPARRLGESLGKLDEGPLQLTNDGQSVVVGIDRGKAFFTDGPAAFAIVPLDGSKSRVVETGGTLIAAHDDGSLLLVRDAAQNAEREIVRVDASGKTTVLWSRRASLRFVATMKDGYVARYETNSTPPDLYLFDRKFQIVRRLSDAEPRLDAIKTGVAESFKTTVPMFDNSLREVNTHVFLPAGAKVGDHLPTIVMFYTGFPFTLLARDFAGGAPNSIPTSIFTTRGYAVLFCDVPIGPEGKAGHPVREMTDAIVAQVLRAAELGYTDIKRVAILGHSYGGYSAAAIVTQTNLFRAAIAFSGLYDLGSTYAWMNPDGSNAFGWAESGQGRMGVPLWSDVQRYIDNSPFYQADKIHTPLLLIHGEKDSACPVAEAKKMYSALKRLDRDVELAVYAGEGHVPGRWSLANAVNSAQRMTGFLDTHLK